ncbi:MAG TPA: phospholipase D-like domain-containing protein, partial [bacterium]|nr:phospholipase D-like domain-containing protein [bacterium]
MTCAEVAGSFGADLAEPNEGRLIRVNNVHVTGSNSDIYTVSDATGSIQLYLDPDAHLPLLPDGAFDIIGLLTQYDPSVRPPKKAGYRIMPRFSHDILSRGAPLLVQPLQESAIEPTMVELVWATDRSSTSLVRFGQDFRQPLTTAGDSALVTTHRVRLEGLEPASLYKAVAWSTDPAGTMVSDTLLFMTASARSSGTIQVYFNQSVDTSKAWREVAQGQTDLSTVIVKMINQARYSLDVHYYSFTHADIALALVNAKRRGVSVRFIADDATATASNDKIRWLREAGIPVIDDYFGMNDSTAASHNKFVIIDHRDRTSGLDDYLWTGSSNASLAGATRNGENMLLIQDETLCEAYTLEFNEMWGSATETPDPAQSRFGARKRDNTPHRFNIGGRWIEQYMSPSDDAERHIIAAIQSADYSLYFCILAFTQSTILNAMRNRFAQISGFVILGVFDRSSVSSSYSVYADMAGAGSSPWSPRSGRLRRRPPS